MTKPSKETTVEEVKQLGLVERLVSMLDAGWTGAIGLSAVQIGVLLRCAVYIPNRIDPDFSKEPVVLMNPVLVKFDNLQPRAREGCISLPGERFNTYRYGKIEFKNDWPHGIVAPEPMVLGSVTEIAQGLTAQVIQHEIDHMNGILCSQRTVRQHRNEKCECGSGIKFKRCHGR